MKQSIIILILDDSQISRKVLRDNLKQNYFDITIHEASTPNKAIEIMKLYDIDVLFVDFYLEKTTGLHFLKLARLKNFDQPAVIFTSSGNHDLVQAVFEYDIFDYIPKQSINSEILLRTLIQLSRLLQTKKENKKMNLKLGQFSQALELNPSMVIITDLFGEIQFVNQKMVEITGYSKKEILGKTAKLFQSGLLPKSSFKAIWDRLLLRKSWTGKLHNRKKNGETYWVSASISPILDAKNEVTHFLAIEDDITEQQESEALLENKKNRFELFDQVTRECIILHRNGKIIDVNKMTLEILGYDYDNLIHSNIISYIHNEYRLIALESLLSDNPDSLDLKIIKKDGTSIYAKSYNKKIKYDNDFIFVTTFQDTTKDIVTKEQLRKAKDEAERANRAKSEFLAKMSHELRTPLNSIIGFAEILLVGIDGAVNEKQSESLSRISKSGQNLLHLINDLLDFSKIEAGKMELNRNYNDITKVIQNCKSIIHPLTQKKKISFEIINKLEDTNIYCDSMRLQQVILNLLSNAVKFTEYGGITLKLTQQENDNVLIQITDTGIGMGEQESKNIFSEFKQADKKISSQYGGTGLGLAISKRLVEMHQGKIWVSSKIDVGSSFFVEIPKHKRNDEHLNTLLNFPRDINDFEGKILILDDEIEITQILEKYLELEKYYCLSINDPELAVNTALSFQPDLIISDVMMPGKNGYQVLKELKENDETSNIPVLFLSGFCDKQLSLELGAIGCLKKPVNRNTLYSKVKENIEKRKSV